MVIFNGDKLKHLGRRLLEPGKALFERTHFLRVNRCHRPGGDHEGEDELHRQLVHQQRRVGSDILREAASICGNSGKICQSHSRVQGKESGE